MEELECRVEGKPERRSRWLSQVGVGGPCVYGGHLSRSPHSMDCPLCANWACVPSQSSDVETTSR